MAVALNGLAWHGRALHVTWQGMHGQTRYDMSWLWHGIAGHGRTWHDMYGMVWQELPMGNGMEIAGHGNTWHDSE